MSADTPHPPRVLLIGWEGADWRLLHPLLSAGAMPNLASLLQQGSIGKLQSPAPLLPAALWTTLATGVSPTAHGILLSEQIAPDRSGLEPVGRSAMRVAPLWEIATAAGLRCHVVNFPATHLPPPVSGIAVSDHFVTAAESPASVHAPGAERELRQLRIAPEEIDLAALLSFVPQARQLDRRDPRLALLARSLAETATLHAAGTWAMEQVTWNLAAIRYTGLQQLSTAFLPFHPPRLPSVSEPDFALFRHVVTAAYRFHDLMLGRLMQLSGPEARVLIVSTHGFQIGAQRPVAPDESSGDWTHLRWHRPQGFIVAAGPGVPKAAPLNGSLLDVAPTVLALLGIEAPSTWAGTPLLPHGRLQPAPAAAPAAVLPPATVADPNAERLIAMGYTSRPDPHAALAERRLEEQRTFHEAIALLDEGRAEWAVPALERLSVEHPAVSEYQIALAHAYARLSRLEAWRRVAAQLAERFPDAPETHLSAGWLALADRRAGEAVELLRRAQTAAQHRSPEMAIGIGSAYLRLRRFAEAREAFEEAIALDSEDADAHAGLAAALLALREPESAATAARRAIELAPRQALHHYRLGAALFAAQRWDEAREALRAAAALDPTSPAILRKLAQACRWQGDLVAAADFDQRAHLAAIQRRPLTPAADTAR